MLNANRWRKVRFGCELQPDTGLLVAFSVYECAGDLRVRLASFRQEDAPKNPRAERAIAHVVNDPRSLVVHGFSSLGSVNSFLSQFLPMEQQKCLEL